MVRTALTVVALILLIAAGPQIAYVFFAGNSYAPPQSSPAPEPVRGALLDSSLDESAEVGEASTSAEIAQTPVEEVEVDAQPIEEATLAQEAEVHEAEVKTEAVRSIGTRGSSGILRLDFDDLSSFEYVDYSQQLTFDINEHEVDGQIPEAFKALDGEIVEVEGFMVPVDVEAGRVHSFILTNSTLLCCFGIMPNLHEWMWVEMEDGQSAEWHNNIPIKVRGKLEVGEEIEDGIIISLYRMTGQRAGLTHEF